MLYRCVSKDDKDYPKRLLHIKKPPERLYYIGDISLVNKMPCIAVVGSRKATEYGKKISYALGGRLAENEIISISGMAQGIDSYAHRGSLDAGGKTIAVLGTGIDICFPSSNKILYEKISENGLILSEYPPGIRGNKFSFPLRNRIISGMAQAVVIVEAGLKSGSLITAELAADQGRTVYAVPGNINNLMSKGTNSLIRDGAIAMAGIDDVIEDLGLKKNISKKYMAELSESERKVVDYVANSGECAIDQIALALDSSAREICELLTILELKGIVSSSMGKISIANF